MPIDVYAPSFDEETYYANDTPLLDEAGNRLREVGQWRPSDDADLQVIMRDEPLAWEWITDKLHEYLGHITRRPSIFVSTSGEADVLIRNTRMAYEIALRMRDGD